MSTSPKVAFLMGLSHEQRERMWAWLVLALGRTEIELETPGLTAKRTLTLYMRRAELRRQASAIGRAKSDDKRLEGRIDRAANH